MTSWVAQTWTKNIYWLDHAKAHQNAKELEAPSKFYNERKEGSKKTLKKCERKEKERERAETDGKVVQRPAASWLETRVLRESLNARRGESMTHCYITLTPLSQFVPNHFRLGWKFVFRSLQTSFILKLLNRFILSFTSSSFKLRNKCFSEFLIPKSEIST